MQNRRHTLCIIPARGGSKGIPRKNLRSLAEKPLIGHVIETVKATSAVDYVVVTTDDEEIAATCRRYEVDVVLRPAELSGDQVTIDPVVAHALLEIEARTGRLYDTVVTVQPTSPLLTPGTLNAAIERFVSNEDTDTLLSAREVRHLSWSKTDDGYKPNYQERRNRAELPPVFHETGAFFVCTAKMVRTTGQRFGEQVDIMVVPEEESVDIDNRIDWALADALLTRKRIAFVVAGNTEVGLGHVYRALSIASDLAAHELHFYCDTSSELAAERIRSYNYNVTVGNESERREAISDFSPHIIVNDTLDTSADYIAALKEGGAKTVSLEDMGPGADLADMVINALYPERHVRENAYHGPDYFVARDEFVHALPKPVQPTVGNVLITFGGTDPSDLTRHVVEAIYPICRDRGIAIDVVLGAGYPSDRAIAGDEGVQVFRDVVSMAERMRAADLIFTSAGRTVYEVACVGVPAIVLAQNARELSHFFASTENGFVNLGLGSELNTKEIAQEFVQLIENEPERRLMNEKMLSNDLKRGRARVIEKIMQSGGK